MKLGSPQSVHRFFDTELIKDFARNLLDRNVRGVEIRNTRLAHQPVRLLQFPATLLQRGIPAARAPLFANLRQTLCFDGEAEQAVLIGTQAGRELQLIQIVLGQGIVGGADTVMQGHV